MKTKLKMFLFALLVTSFMLMAFRPLWDVTLPEPLGTILFFVLVPLLVQGIKVYRDKAGKEPPRIVIEGVSLVLSAIFVFLAGGFAAIVVPQLPTWGGDTAVFITAAVAFVKAVAIALYLAWAAVSKLYDLIFKRVLEGAGFATTRALKERAASR